MLSGILPYFFDRPACANPPNFRSSVRVACDPLPFDLIGMVKRLADLREVYKERLRIGPLHLLPPTPGQDWTISMSPGGIDYVVNYIVPDRTFVYAK